MNTLDGRVTAGRIDIAGAGSLTDADARDGEVTVGVRPNGFEAMRGEGEGLIGELVGQEYLGSETFLHARLRNKDIVVVQEHPDHVWKLGETIRLQPRPGNIHLFDAKTGVRLAGNGAGDGAR